mmetsp:Transcript_25575/g.65865  ORF Transcript_25575/g.65865 Transcript_25575/m.65865 type:complete len:665 (+) Transcript_25575:305-2299(+)|eukprot:jgi/Tetstr1/460382/TSEL_000060.t1
MAPKAAGKDQLQQKSPAEFFAENKNIAGFDNPGKSLYTTMRELVENSLDAAESAMTLPDIDVTIEEISQRKLNTIRGVENHDRLDDSLYDDYETTPEKKKREAKEARENKRLEKVALQKGGAAAAQEAKKLEKARNTGSKERFYYRITVKDNGMGMPHESIPNMLGRVLSGTKYGMKQNRGRFGLGAKMALIWSKMSTGLPVEVYSATKKSGGSKSFYRLSIDIHRNQPDVRLEKHVPNPDNWVGSEVSLIVEGNMKTYRAKILKYLRQIAVITPYASFRFRFKAEDDKASIRVNFLRRTDKMPLPPPEIKHHPSAVDLELIKRLVAVTKYTNLQNFLANEFSQISKSHAARLIEEMRSGVSIKTAPRELDERQIVRMHQLLHEARFSDPDSKHLSPAGEYNLRLGIMKECSPDMVATYQSEAKVFEGHAFIVEAGVSLGGKDMKPGVNIFRYANRIPLLFEGGSDVITKTAGKRINWTSYKINQNSDKVGVFVSIVSTKIPFKGAGKEYIGDDIDEMVGACKQAITQCALQLKSKITRVQAAREQRNRKKALQKYIPNAAAAIYTVLDGMVGNAARGPKRRKLESASTLLQDLKQGVLLEEHLEKKLHEHVERIDMDMALEYQMQVGIRDGKREDAYLVPKGVRHAVAEEVHMDCAVIQLLHA